MQNGAATPVRLTGARAARVYWRLMRDPLAGAQAVHAAYGPFVILADPLPLIPIRKVVALTAGAQFNREVLNDPATWRTVRVSPAGPKNSAARRLSWGIVRMNGRQHDHYRRLLVPPLRKSSIEDLGSKMVDIAETEIENWPIGEPIDLWVYVRRLMRTFAIALLFGNDRKQGYPIADMINRGLEFNWSLKPAACPINLPFTPYGKSKRLAETLERSILEWAACKRGHLDRKDLLSIVVNNPDENGEQPSDAVIAGHVPTLFGAAYETCQNALIWTVILVAQHARVAHMLLDELQSTFAGAPLTLSRIAELPFLDAVLKESLRIMPPVPMQYRVAERNTRLAEHPVERGVRVVLNAFLINRAPDLYPEPDHFRPQRWSTINPSAFEYAVFSGGPRNCPGYWFGINVVKVAIATILLRYRVALAKGLRIDYKVRVAASPRGQVTAFLLRQDGAFAAAPLCGDLCKLISFPQT